MIKAGRRLHELGGCEGSAGNLSAGLGEIDPRALGWTAAENFGSPREEELDLNPIAGSSFVLTTSGARLGFLEGDGDFSLVRVREDGRSIEAYVPRGAEGATPTTELRPHLAAHAARRTKAAIDFALHVQPVLFTALSHKESMADPFAFNTAVFRWQAETIIGIPAGVGVVPWHLPGSPELARASAARSLSHDAILWRKHGLFVIGNRWKTMIDQVELLEVAARYALALKDEEAGLTREEMRAIAHQYGVRNPYLPQ